jgi:branched-chain amino acid transport system substrate-binding protein
LVELAGAGFEGNYFSNHYSPDATDPAVVKFVQSYKKIYGGALPPSMAALGYDAAYVLADALKRAKNLTAADLRDAIATTQDYPGVTGKISIDPQRNARKSAVVLKTTHGHYEYTSTISP